MGSKKWLIKYCVNYGSEVNKVHNTLDAKLLFRKWFEERVWDKTMSSTSRRRGVEEPHDMREFICGWGAAFVNINMTFPINKVIFRYKLFVTLSLFWFNYNWVKSLQANALWSEDTESCETTETRGFALFVSRDWASSHTENYHSVHYVRDIRSVQADAGHSFAARDYKKCCCCLHGRFHWSHSHAIRKNPDAFAGQTVS